jgi:dynactin 1
MTQAYLPDPYHDTEADSTTILLFFHRISAKIEMLVHVISAVHGLPAALHTAQSEALVGICELRGKLEYFGVLNRRFGAVVSRGTPDEWVGYGKVLGEVTGVETRVDGWIALIKADEFREGECARELGR